MDSGTGDAAVSRTSPVRAGWMGLLTGRAGRAVVAAGTGTGTMTLAGQWTDARRAMGRLHRSGPRRPPESSPHSPGGSSSASNHRASRPSAAARAVSVACYAAAAVLVTFAALACASPATIFRPSHILRRPPLGCDNTGVPPQMQPRSTRLHR